MPNFRLTYSGTVGSVSGTPRAVLLNGVPINPASLQDVADAINNNQAQPTNEIIGICQLVLNIAQFVLSGGPNDGTYDFVDLPAGFTPVGTISLDAQIGADGAAPDIGVEVISTIAGSSGVFAFGQTLVLNYPTSPVPTALDLNTDIITVNLTQNSGIRNPIVLHNSFDWMLQIHGAYELQNFQWTLDRSTQPVQSGTQVTITSDPNDPNHLELNHVDITIDGQDPPTIIFVNEFLLIFIIPILVGTPQSLVSNAVGDGTQFSGSVPLGHLETIYFLNAPGIYKLDPTATSDTLYDTDNGGTVEVAIPDPFFETGFIGG